MTSRRDEKITTGVVIVTVVIVTAMAICSQVFLPYSIRPAVDTTDTVELTVQEIVDTEVESESSETTVSETVTEEVIETTCSDALITEETSSEQITEYMYVGGFDDDAYYIAKTIGVEAPYCSRTEQAAVAWTILNRVDDSRFPSTVREVVTAPNQFAYFDTTPVRDDLYYLALDVLGRWALEKAGEPVVGRVLPREYLYFWGDCVAHNYFTITENSPYYWNWSWDSPYEEEE